MQTGVELATYFSQVKNVDFYDDSYSATSEIYSRFPSVPQLVERPPVEIIYTTDLKNYNENQSVYYLNIPIMLRYTGILKMANGQASSAAGYAGTYASENRIFVSGGIKIGIPLSAKVEQSAASLLLDGESALTHDKWSESNLPPDVVHEYGFGNRTGEIIGTRSLAMKLGITASLEAGYEHPINEHWNLYGGVYFDYGLVNLLDKTASRLVQPNDGRAPTIATYAAASDKVTNMAVGVIIRASFAYLFRHNKYEDKSVDIDFDTSRILGR
ncbi:hypothetical protein FACS1894156_4780 [Bacteroidia bacterium]|nr:hypothetical protein FACS1894156_4780 [Bacteroidia bacterium]